MAKKLIAITGGIGSGKSLALSVIEKAGYPTLSSDKIVKDLYKKPSVKRLLKDLFPSAVKGEKRLTIDYKALSGIAFKNKKNNKKLTKAITPLVLNEIYKKAKRIKEDTFVEVPLLFECKFEDKFDNVLIILRDKEKRIESVKTRSKLTEKQIEKRMKNQVAHDKLDLSKYSVIKNELSLKEFEEQVLKTAKKIIE